MKTLILYMIGFTVVLSSCSMEPERINYGKEACHFCSMTIVDNQHAAELVTTKGKSYKFDAIECMINYINRNDVDASVYLVCDYANPGTLIPANSATFLISKEISSPMGAFLSGFSSNEEALNTQKNKTGDLYSWDSVQEQIK